GLARSRSRSSSPAPASDSAASLVPGGTSRSASRSISASSCGSSRLAVCMHATASGPMRAVEARRRARLSSPRRSSAPWSGGASAGWGSRGGARGAGAGGGGAPALAPPLPPLVVVGVGHQLADLVVVHGGLGREVLLERAVHEVHPPRGGLAQQAAALHQLA